MTLIQRRLFIQDLLHMCIVNWVIIGGISFNCIPEFQLMVMIGAIKDSSLGQFKELPLSRFIQKTPKLRALTLDARMNVVMEQIR